MLWLINGDKLLDKQPHLNKPLFCGFWWYKKQRKLEGFKIMNKEQNKKLHQLAREYGFNCGEVLMIGDYFGFDIVNQIFKHRQHELHKKTLFNICESYQEDTSSYDMDRFNEQLELQTY